MNEAERLEFMASLEGTLPEDAELAARAVDDLGDKSEVAAIKLRALDREAKSTGNQLALLAAKAKAASLGHQSDTELLHILTEEYRRNTAAQGNHTRSVARLRKEYDKTHKTIKLFGQEIQLQKKHLADAKKGFVGFLGYLGKITSMGMMAGKAMLFLSVGMGAVGLVAGAINLVPALFSVAGQLSTLLSFAALLPTAIGSLIATVLTLKMALNGVGKTIGAAFQGDWLTFEQSINKLSPAAAQFVRQLVKFVPAMKNIQKTVQENFFKPLTGQIDGFMAKVLPVIGDGSSRLAGSLSKIAVSIMQWTSSGTGLNFLTRLFDAGQMFAEKFAEHVGPVLDGLERVSAVVAPIWARLTNGMGSAMDKFGAWLTRISDDGTLERWLNTAIDVSKTLGGTFKSLLRIVMAIAGASDGGSLNRMSAFFDRLATFLESPAGTQMLTTFFETLMKVTDALEPALPPLAMALVLIAQALADMVIGAAPGLVTFLQEMAKAIASIGQGDPQFWVKLGESLGQVMVDLAKALPAIASILHDVLGWLSDKNHLEIALAIGVALTLLVNLATWLIPLIGGIVGLISAIGVEAAAVIAVILLVVAAVVAIGIAVAFVVTHWRNLGDYIKQWIDGVSYMIGFMVGWIVGKFVEVKDAIVYAFNEPMKTLDALWEKLKALGNKIKEFWDGLHPSNWFSDVAKFFGAGYDAGRWMGGPVDAGKTYMTNELGPEKFLSDTGKLTDIGDGGMGKWTAPSAGIVIPAHLTDTFDKIAAAAKGRYGQDMDNMHEPALSRLGTRTGTTTLDQRQYHLPITVVNPKDGTDVEGAVKTALKKFKKDEEERS